MLVTETRRGLARRRRLASKATFIGVTGSSTKSTTTTLLAHILTAQAPTRSQVINNSASALTKCLRGVSREEKYVVSELGISHTQGMRPMARMLLPDVSIVTMIGIEHYTAFKGRQAVADEKGILVESTRPDGLVLLNADDEFTMAMAARTKARVVTFGRSEKADYRVLSTAGGIPEGLTVEIGWKGGTLELKTGFLGEHFWLPVVAAAAAALELGVPPELIKRQAATATALPNRFERFAIEDGPTFIIDTAKAPKGTLDLAFDALRKADVPFKRIVLGQISDYTGPSRAAYRKAYKAAREAADEVVFAGDTSHRSGASEEDRQSGRFVEIASARQAYDYIRSTARKDEVILLKCSPSQHFERLAMAWTTDVQCWVDRCGKIGSCRACGLYPHPFEQHQGRLAKRSRRFGDRLKFWVRAA